LSSKCVGRLMEICVLPGARLVLFNLLVRIDFLDLLLYIMDTAIWIRILMQG
jgi:hypothetical protein